MKVKNLQIKYGDNIVIDNVTFDVENGEILGVLGKNGVGKTTLLNAIVGIKKNLEVRFHF